MESFQLSLRCNAAWTGQTQESCGSDSPATFRLLKLLLECTQTLLPLLGLLMLLPVLKEQWSSSSRCDGVREGGVWMIWEVLNTWNASWVHPGPLWGLGCDIKAQCPRWSVPSLAQCRSLALSRLTVLTDAFPATLDLWRGTFYQGMEWQDLQLKPFHGSMIL